MSRRDQPPIVSPGQSHRLRSRWESPRFGDIVGSAPWQKRWSDISKYRFTKRRPKRSDVRDENNLEDSSLSCSWSHPPNQKSAVFFGMSIGHFSKKAVVAILSRHKKQKHWHVTKNQKIAKKLTWNFERIGFATRDAERPILNANSVADPRMWNRSGQNKSSFFCPPRAPDESLSFGKGLAKINGKNVLRADQNSSISSILFWFVGGAGGTPKMPFILATPVVEIQIVSENPSATRVFHMVVEKPILPNKICTNTSNPPAYRSRHERKYTLIWPHRY